MEHKNYAARLNHIYKRVWDLWDKNALCGGHEYSMIFCSKNSFSPEGFTKILEYIVAQTPKGLDNGSFDNHVIQELKQMGIDFVGNPRDKWDSPYVYPTREDERTVEVLEGIVVPDYVGARPLEGYPGCMAIPYDPKNLVIGLKTITYIQFEETFRDLMARKFSWLTELFGSKPTSQYNGV